MAKKDEGATFAQNADAPAFVATSENADKTRQKQLQGILAERMQAVEKFGKMTPKMQRGFDRFAANISNITKE